jgi:ABC-type multidrug transport system ATPase subunit
MEIKIENLGKRFNREWIFRNLNLSFQINKSYAITGPNGSGKSTLLQILTGMMPFSEGKLSFLNQQEIDPDNYYKFLSIAAPYQELIEEFTLEELVDFHLKFKEFKSISKDEFYERLLLVHSIHKEIRFFSSGMKQRVKLGLAMYTDSPILFLDEPTSNLDSQGTEWYLNEIQNNLSDRIVIICSNQTYEYSFCNEVINLRPQQPKLI